MTQKKLDKWDSLERELFRLEERAMYSSQAQFEQSKLWRGVNLIIGGPAAIIAAISAATGLATVANRVLAAYLALIAAGLGALATILNSNRRSEKSHEDANTYLEIQTIARQTRKIDLPLMSYEEARKKLDELSNMIDETNKGADLPSFYAYWRCKRNIKKGRQEYLIDEEGTSNGQDSR